MQIRDLIPWGSNKEAKLRSQTRETPSFPCSAT